MRLMTKQFMAVAHQTTREATRQPICVLLTAFGIAFASLLPLMISHTFGESGKIIRDSALALFLLLGLLLSGFLASKSLATEFRQGMASSILTKPINRNLFFLAKYAGLCVVVFFYAVAMSLVVLLCDYVAQDMVTIHWRIAAPLMAITPMAFVGAGVINYLSGRNFAASAFAGLIFCTGLVGLFSLWSIKQAPTPSMLHWQILYAGVLCSMALMLFTGIATVLATRLDTSATLLICLLIFVLGLMSDYLFGRVADTQITAYGLYALIPNWQHFWMADALSSENSIPLSYLWHAGTYAFLYLAAILSLGMLSIHKLDLT